ncbi:MAG: glycosyltransferase [Prevotellaceae bacterium]|nr:glycosyltransferase [Prevotellaceae bacterium]
MVVPVILTLTGLFFVMQLLYYLLLYSRIWLRAGAVRKKRIPFTQELPPLSVIICAHDQEEDLRRHLTAVLEQDYPQFEVIVIHDGNADDSDDYLTRLEEQYSHLYHSFVPESSRYISRKKLAVTLGVKAGKYDWLVFTSPNCQPAGNQWLRTLARNFTPQTSIVLGYSGYLRGKGMLQKRVAYDNLFTSMRYLGCALCASPYMGIGRNMAYRKSLFFEQKGLSSHLNLKRGEDDLFVNTAATGKNTRVETAAAATMQIPAVTHANDWEEEKIGYVQTARYYRGLQRYLLGFETFTRLLFHLCWMSTLVLALAEAAWIMAGTAFLFFLLRWGLQMMVVNKTAKALGEPRRYYLTLFLMDWLQPLQSLRWKLTCLFRSKYEFMRK